MEKIILEVRNLIYYGFCTNNVQYFQSEWKFYRYDDMIKDFGIGKSTIF